MNAAKALIIDDSKFARYALSKKLQLLNLNVEMAESGEEAINKLSHVTSSLPNIIFIDQFMPGMDGLATVQRIKNNPKWRNISIVLCAAETELPMIPNAEMVGASAILPKPANSQRIHEIIHQLGLNGAINTSQPMTAANQASEATHNLNSTEFAQPIHFTSRTGLNKGHHIEVDNRAQFTYPITQQSQELQLSEMGQTLSQQVVEQGEILASELNEKLEQQTQRLISPLLNPITDLIIKENLSNRLTQSNSTLYKALLKKVQADSKKLSSQMMTKAQHQIEALAKEHNPHEHLLKFEEQLDGLKAHINKSMELLQFAVTDIQIQDSHSKQQAKQAHNKLLKPNQSFTTKFHDMQARVEALAKTKEEHLKLKRVIGHFHEKLASLITDYAENPTQKGNKKKNASDLQEEVKQFFETILVIEEEISQLKVSHHEIQCLFEDSELASGTLKAEIELLKNSFALLAEEFDPIRATSRGISEELNSIQESSLGLTDAVTALQDDTDSIRTEITSLAKSIDKINEHALSNRQLNELITALETKVKELETDLRNRKTVTENLSALSHGLDVDALKNVVEVFAKESHEKFIKPVAIDIAGEIDKGIHEMNRNVEYELAPFKREYNKLSIWVTVAMISSTAAVVLSMFV